MKTPWVGGDYSGSSCAGLPLKRFEDLSVWRGVAPGGPGVFKRGENRISTTRNIDLEKQRIEFWQRATNQVS